ncbi:MAG: aminopeptidase [Candidatus Bathyarchaeota archaeon]|nr:aminopeptidase [Candidatus Bathyarchaeota archaeon]
MAVPTFVRKVVRSCLRIGKKDRVMICSWRHMMSLAEAFAMECKRNGAHTIVELLSDDVWYDAVTNLPLDFVEIPDPFSLALADVATANIFFSGPENPERMKGVPAERWVALSRADRPYYEKIVERKVRTAELTLGHVTPQRARTYGFDYKAWDKNVRDATDVEYASMQQLGQKLAKILEKSREVEITSPEGTNLSFSLEGRRAHVKDGVIDDEDIEMGAIFSSLPDGSVLVAPTETSAEGFLKSNTPFPHAGSLVESLSLSFDNGRLSAFAGGKNSEALRNMWEKATGNKDRIGWLQLGLNPKASIGFTYDHIVLGTATIGIGLNKELRGRNESDWGLPVTLEKSTVKLDGKMIIKQGKLCVS